MLFSCFLSKNEEEHIDEASSHGGNYGITRAGEHVSAQQALGCVMMTSEQQKHCWICWQLVVNLTCAPVYL